MKIIKNYCRRIFSLNDVGMWFGERLRFTRMLIALITVQTVNLKEIAIALVSKAEVDSRYKRLRRFFSQFNLNYDFIARFIFNLFFSGKKVYLTIDRTNWFLGKAKINILMLGVAYEGVACVISPKSNTKFRFSRTPNIVSLEHQISFYSNAQFR